MNDVKDLAPVSPGGGAAVRRATAKRLVGQRLYEVPQGAKPLMECLPLGFGYSVVSVSVVARDWNISARRVRVMLAQGRLPGRQLDNGYWEVFYPYSYVFGTRGPSIRRQPKIKVLAASDVPDYMKTPEY